MEEEVQFSNAGFNMVGMIRKAQADTINDTILLIQRLAGAPGLTENEKTDAGHMVMRLQSMLRTI